MRIYEATGLLKTAPLTGTALSVYGVTGSSNAPRADIVAGADDTVLARRSGAVTFVASVPFLDTANDFTDVNTFIQSIAGDPGFEGSGITVSGVTYESSAKVSDIGGSSAAQFILHRHSTTLAPIIVASRTNSDTASHAVVADTQALFQLYGVGWDGTDYAFGALIEMVVNGTPGSNDMPTDIVFYTSADGTQTLTEHLRVAEDGTVAVSNSALFDLNSVTADLDGTTFTADYTTLTLTGGSAVTTLSGTEIDLTATTLDFNGNADVSGTLDVHDLLTVEDATVTQLDLKIGAARRAFLSYTESTVILRLDSDGQIVFAPNNTTALTLGTDQSATFAGNVATQASTASIAGLNIPHGTAPSSPVDGDVWTTSAGLFVRINGSTIGPLS